MNLPGFNFHALRGFVPTRYTVHVNGPWCITFEFDAGDALRVDFEQLKVFSGRAARSVPALLPKRVSDGRCCQRFGAKSFSGRNVKVCFAKRELKVCQARDKFVRPQNVKVCRGARSRADQWHVF
jgi:hypothetical protein